MNDTRIPLVLATLSYWLIAFPCGWWFAFHTSLGAVGVWVGLSIGTAVYATLLLLRFRLLARKLAFP
jgi:multidrug resistance protein, MATE family